LFAGGERYERTEIDEERIWSSTGALMQKTAPGSLFIVGAGAIGMEFADNWSFPFSRHLNQPRAEGPQRKAGNSTRGRFAEAVGTMRRSLWI